jgi:hypothetical protein
MGIVLIVVAVTQAHEGAWDHLSRRTGEQAEGHCKLGRRTHRRLMRDGASQLAQSSHDEPIAPVDEEYIVTGSRRL